MNLIEKIKDLAIILSYTEGFEQYVEKLSQRPLMLHESEIDASMLHENYRNRLELQKELGHHLDGFENLVYNLKESSGKIFVFSIYTEQTSFSVFLSESLNILSVLENPQDSIGTLQLLQKRYKELGLDTSKIFFIE